MEGAVSPANVVARAGRQDKVRPKAERVAWAKPEARAPIRGNPDTKLEKAVWLAETGSPGRGDEI